jgi:RNA polymerase subunit RPABC4/transcription elongation factor Spt4
MTAEPEQEMTSVAVSLTNDPTCPICGDEYDGHRAAAPLACPMCGHGFTGHWHHGREPKAQQCPMCGHCFDATWPGFHFEPETIIVRRQEDR